MELTDVDNTLIIKNKIDPLKIFSSNDYTHELSNYIQFLIKNGIEVDPELFKNITDVKRYPSFNSWPRLESVCADIFEQVIKKGIDIEDEKYSEILLGLQSNDSMSENFVYRMIYKNLDYPMSFEYVFDEPQEAYYLFEKMVRSGYSKHIPDFIFENISKDMHYIVLCIRTILQNDGVMHDYFLKYIDLFTEKLINLHFIPLIDKTKNLKKLPSFDYLEKLETYIDELLFVLKELDNKNIPNILLKFLKSTKFKNHIKQYFDFNPKDNRYNISTLKKILSKFTDKKINESYSFKEYFKRK